MSYPVTPDGLYFLVDGRLRRCADPNLAKVARRKLLAVLTDARRAVKEARTEKSLREARTQVNSAKAGLGEIGNVRQAEPAPDYNEELARETPYAKWEQGLGDAS